MMLTFGGILTSQPDAEGRVARPAGSMETVYADGESGNQDEVAESNASGKGDDNGTIGIDGAAGSVAASATIEQLVQVLVAQVRATPTHTREFAGFLELADVLVDIEFEGLRCLLLRTPPDRAALPTLSPRELEIARMVTKGLPNKSIAKVLQISTWTVASHLRRIFTKLDVSSRAEMVGRLLEEGRLTAVGELRH